MSIFTCKVYQIFSSQDATLGTLSFKGDGCSRSTSSLRITKIHVCSVQTGHQGSHFPGGGHFLISLPPTPVLVLGLWHGLTSASLISALRYHYQHKEALAYVSKNMALTKFELLIRVFLYNLRRKILTDLLIYFPYFKFWIYKL